jgi:predicted transcriptional regulator
MGMTEFTMYFNQNYADVTQWRKSILESLKEGPASVSTISEKTEMDKKVLMWNLLGLLRWGDIEIIGEEHHELVFRLREV